MTDPITIHHQIRAVEREIKMRQQVYPKLVANRKMRAGEAEYQINLMVAVLATLSAAQTLSEWVATHTTDFTAPAELRAFCKGVKHDAAG